MNVVEQQLLCALKETPAETECSVSVRVLESLGREREDVQKAWLSSHRPPRDGKQWYHSGDRWEYCSEPPESAPSNTVSSPMPARMVSTPTIGSRSIVVKPLAPLKRVRN